MHLFSPQKIKQTATQEVWPALPHPLLHLVSPCELQQGCTATFSKVQDKGSHQGDWAIWLSITQNPLRQTTETVRII